MTAIEKRKFLDLIGRCVRHDFLSDTDVNKILDLCYAAVAEKLTEQSKKAEEGEE